MRKFLKILPFLVLLGVVSCRTEVGECRPTVQYVRDILAGKYPGSLEVLSRNSKPLDSGAIVVIGGGESVRNLIPSFLGSDSFDNVSAAPVPDGLADFCGETLVGIVDAVRTDSLRRNCVELTVAALDTAYSVTPYDIECLGSRPAAKMIVLADPVYRAFGRFDVDTLFRASGCTVPVITPIGAMFDRLDLSTVRNIGVICEVASEEDGIYLAAVAEELRDRGLGGISCSAFAVNRADTANVMVSFLDRYRESGGSAPLDAILVDDPAIDPSRAREDLNSITSLSSSLSVIYGQFVSKDAVILDAASSTTACCFRKMRDSNLFTHNISQPSAVAFVTCPRPADAPVGPALIIPSSYVQD